MLTMMIKEGAHKSMTHRRQTKQYSCIACGSSYLHDDAYAHTLFLCELRPKTRKQLLEQFLLNGRCYHPMAERTR